jgi:hypothetical protein
MTKEGLSKWKARQKELDNEILESQEFIGVLKEKLSTLNVDAHDNINLTPEEFGFKLVSGGGYSYNGDVEVVKTKDDAIQFYVSLYDMSELDPIRFGFIDASTFPKGLENFPEESCIYGNWFHSTLINWPQLIPNAMKRLKNKYPNAHKLRSNLDKWRYIVCISQEIEQMYKRQEAKKLMVNK